MNTDLKNNIIFEDESTELFSRLRIPWKQSKEEIWVGVSKQIQSTRVIKLQPKMAYWKLAIAAIFIVSFSLTIFLRTYTVSINSFENKLVFNELPDGSNITLNANSTIKYHPYWWWANRSIDLNGEAFFQVQKGKTFIVKSESGITEVLGTTFNVFARGQSYEVICVTGKVKVQATQTSHAVILHPSQKASLLESGELEVKQDIHIKNINSWRSSKLIFTSISLIDVFKEIEQLYRVNIMLPVELDQQYTGSFDKPGSVEDVLQLICRPFDLKVVKVKDHQYQIFK
jgi:transmembrane sensor